MQSFSYKFLNAINPQVDYFDASKGFKMILLSEVQTDSLKTVSDKAFEFWHNHLVLLKQLQLAAKY